MNDAQAFGAVVAAVAAAMAVAVLSNRISERIRVPAPAIFLLGAAVASDLAPSLATLSTHVVQRIVSVALAVILFDGGMQIGWRQLRGAAGAVLWMGVAGTLVTATALTGLTHLLGFGWREAMLVGTALSPTDPAVVFSVLGRREVSGRTGTILAGESGANDPVGIALMAALLAAGGSGGLGALWVGVGAFALQMGVGGAIGIAGGVALRLFMQRVPLPSEALYPLRTLAGALALYGVATIAHGSGFLAVFVAGIMLGDVRAPYKREVTRFHGALASLGEIVAFTVLGLTVSLRTLPTDRSLGVGLILAVLLAFLVRPLLVGLLIIPVSLSRGERVFLLWSGLKGAVPILLGTFAITASVVEPQRLYHVIFVVVAFSVIVQGGLVPWLAAKCGVPMRVVEPEPWSVGVRLRQEPEDLHRFTIEAGSPADGRSIQELTLGQTVWISLLTRAGRLVPVRGNTVLRAGDEVIAMAEPADVPALRPLFAKADD